MLEPAVKGMDTRNIKVEFMFQLEKKFNTF